MKALIVEDDTISSAILEKILINMGHEVETASNGNQALELVNKIPIQLIITDWLMPEMDGLELCRRIRELSNNRYMYIIVLTVKDEKEAMVQILHSGADDFVSKPFDADELMARVSTGERIVTLNEKLIQTSEEMQAKNSKLEATLKRLEETQTQMLQSEKMASIGQLAAGVAHEINNPTGFVSSNLKTLADYQQDISRLLAQYGQLLVSLASGQNESVLPEPVKTEIRDIKAFHEEIDLDFLLEDITDLISDCREGTERIKRIVLDLKDFAHPGEDRIQLTDINKGLESTLNVVNNEIKYKATVEKDFGDIPPIRGYPQQLNQVFMNILVNAAQAIEKHGVIKVTTRSNDGHVEVTISDNGCGIESKNLDKIFDPFFTTKGVGRGTGLGMHIAYKIIEKHHGRVSVESQVGEGTTFAIRLPVEEEEQSQIPSKAKDTLPSEG
jgi:signal transduction histidine kinase